MSDLAVTPRTQALLSRVDSWSDQSAARGLLIKAAVTVAGPLVILAGVAMLVLPGPGLVVMAAGLGLLALEYPWARHLLTRTAHTLARLKGATLPEGASGGRRALGLLAVAATLVAGFLCTTAITAFLGAHTFL